MKEGQKVKLHGIWGSCFTKRVELTLKCKGIPYEYVEENLMNKSELPLRYNPVHKKVSVLVHNQKPIAESLVILEYIEENWTNTLQLLPTDPYQRAKVRFWAKFIDEQLFQSLGLVITKEGEAQEKARKDLAKNLKLVDEGIEEFFSGGEPAFDGKSPIFLNIVLISLLGPYQINEKVTGVKIIDPEMNPLIFSWVTALKEVPEVKEATPPLDKLEALVRYIRERALQSSRP